MKRLLVLWDPENPLTPVGSVISSLRTKTELLEVTFDTLSHRTLPNRACEVLPLIERAQSDALLWVEGGPFPSDLDRVRIPKACWLLNLHHEPSLLEDVAPSFNRGMASTLDSCAEGGLRWVPLAAGNAPPPVPPPGISVLLEDPKPPLHAAVEGILASSLESLPSPARPVVFCLGQKGRPHPMLFDCLRSGAAVVVDPESDLRGLAQAGEHVGVFPSVDGLKGFLRELVNDAPRLEHLASRGPQIVQHLHTPDLRSTQLLDALWPRETVLGGKDAKPKVSVLVTCHRYLKRFRFCLESLARQDLPAGSIEIVVADPESPDGLAAHLVEFAKRHPHLRVVRLPLDPRYHRNRGIAINRAFDASSGEVIVSIDGDLVFPPQLLRALAEKVLHDPQCVFGVRRSFISKDVTERILAGEVDPFGRFDELSRSEGDGEENPFVGVLGYCQAVERKAFIRARYPEELDMVNQSDIVFIERLAKKADVQPRFLEEHTVLHLWHPRNWSGTTEFL